MNVADIAFVGSGLAASVTLNEIFKKLLEAPAPAKTLSIKIIEKNPELWLGVPYGSRSSVNSLTITCVLDFIHESERETFFNWLVNEKSTWVSYYRERGGITAERWLENNLPLIDQAAWDIVYIPRFVYGLFLWEKLKGLLQQVQEKHLVELTIIHAEVEDLHIGADGVFTLEHDNGSETIVARKVVVATGSAPVKKMIEAPDASIVYVNDIYEPCINRNLTTVFEKFKTVENKEDRNLLIIGTNASSIELLYILEGMVAERAGINKIVAISPSGILPYAISTENLTEHPTPNLDQLKERGNYNLEALVDTCALDLKLAIKNGAHVAYIATVITYTLKLMEVLGEDARRVFLGKYGMYLSNMFRRSGPEYKKGSQDLLDSGQATLIKGKFLNVTMSGRGAQMQYVDMNSGTENTHPLHFNAIVNCSGSYNLDESPSRLIYNLVHKKICTMNLSNKGFEVNEHFEAAPNLYVMGPLLGGNMNKLIHFWHLENASRLIYLAPYLADELLKS